MTRPVILPGVPALVLAPMEGVTDAPMRALQGECGTFTHGVTEFLRISHSIPGRGVFMHHVPELRQDGITPTGLPVQVQILGGDPVRMAAAAKVACEAAGARAIDINFGCPAPTVNKHDGGATLLKHPTRLRDIVRAVRDALPAEVPVSAKLRLGWDNVDAIFENAAMAAEGGASWLTIHARTRAQGYAPPVDWPLVGRVRQSLSIPVVANGDIWTIEGFRQCRAETGCEHFMIGRGALANPALSGKISQELGLKKIAARPASDWADCLRRLTEWTKIFTDPWANRTLIRMKQWLRMAGTFGEFARFDEVKRATNLEELTMILNRRHPAAS